MTPTVYTWSDLRHISPIFQPMIFCHAELSPEQCIVEVVPKLLTVPDGKRCVLLRHACPTMLNGVHNPAGLLTVWPNPQPYYTWLVKVLEGIKAAGIELNRVVVEYEEGFNSWSLHGMMGGWDGRSNWFAALWNSPAYNLLPSYIRARPVSAYQAAYYDREALIDWWQYADGVRNVALRQAITVPVHSIHGPHVHVANYEDSYAEFPTYYHSPWPRAYDGMGNGGSPSIYLFWRHSDRRVTTLQAIIDGVNVVRAHRRIPCAPWVTLNRAFPHDAPPMYSYDDTAELLAHCAESGIGSDAEPYLYWYSDGTPDSDHQIAAEVFSGLQVRPRAELPEIPFDSVSIPHLPPIVPHVCPEPNIEGVRRSMAWELYGRDMLTLEDLVELGYPRRKMSRGPLQRVLGC